VSLASTRRRDDDRDMAADRIATSSSDSSSAHPKRPHRIPAAHGRAVHVRAGEVVHVTNPSGTQVVDTWAFAGAHEWLSMEHCREVLQRLWFDVGDTLVSNRYTPLLTILEDTSPGRHDTLIAACSAEMFARMGGSAGHRNCRDNLQEAAEQAGLRPAGTPAPWNLFMSAPVSADGAIAFRRPDPCPGARVVLRAEAELTLVFSACPDDLYPTNGGDGSPRDVEVIVHAARPGDGT
jgi:uncharacterized protein